jgi:hypothetical protein
VYGAHYVAVWLTYLLGKQLRGRAAGLVAALALALTYAHVATGQWVKEDVPAAFFHTASTVLLVSVLMRARPKDSMFSGVLGGLGMATKYYSIGLLIPAAFAHLFPAKHAAPRMRMRVALLGTFFVLFLAGFFIGSPYNFIRPDFLVQQVWPNVQRMLRLTGLGWVFGAIGEPQAPRIGRFVETGDETVVDVCRAVVESLYLPEGLGLAFFVLALGGLVLSLVRRTKADAFLLVAILGQAVFIALGNRQYSEPRHLVVLYPLLAVWIADSALWAAGKLRKPLARFASAGVGCAVVLVAALLPSVWRDRTQWSVGDSAARMIADRSLEPVRGHTGLAALRWFEQNVPGGSVVIDDHEVLPLRPGEARADWAIDRNRHGGANVWTYRKRWEFRKLAAADPFRPVYDIIVVEAPWGAENRDELEVHRMTYDQTWPHSFETEPGSVDPVARYTAAPPGARAILETRPESREALKEAWPASEFLLDARPVEWLVSSEVSYNNYATDTPAHRKKRAAFPDRAAFYDDLKDHYDCRQWSSRKDGLAGPTIRVYDLRKRVSENPEVIEMGAGTR